MHKHTKNTNDENRETYELLAKIFDTEEKKLVMILGSLGQAALLTLFIAECLPLQELPPSVLYCIALTAANMKALTSGETEHSFVDLSDDRVPEIGEQNQEAIYRKAVKLIKELHKAVVEKENEEIL